jgi:hypothetical protein
MLHRPESMQIIRLFHQRRRHGGVDLRCGLPLVTHLLPNHGYRHASHQRIHHMAVPEDVGRHLSPGGFARAETILDPGLFRQSGLWSGAQSWCTDGLSSGRAFDFYTASVSREFVPLDSILWQFPKIFLQCHRKH